MEGGVLTEVQGEVDGVGVLDARQHGLALPPGGILLVVVVGQVDRAVLVPAVLGVADVAGLGDPGGAGLDAVFLRRGAAGVGRHHRHVESGVDELGHAALRSALLVLTFVHRPADTHRRASPRDQRSDQATHFFSPFRKKLPSFPARPNMTLRAPVKKKKKTFPETSPNFASALIAYRDS